MVQDICQNFEVKCSTLNTTAAMGTHVLAMDKNILLLDAVRLSLAISGGGYGEIKAALGRIEDNLKVEKKRFSEDFIYL